MKPHEETWAAGIWLHDSNQDPIWAIRSDHNNPLAGDVELPFCEFEANERDRARLAAAAPEMARLLLALEWSGCECEMDSGGADACPSCGERAPQTIHVPAKRVDAFTRVEAHDEIMFGRHAPDCQLLAVLRKAGVLD